MFDPEPSMSSSGGHRRRRRSGARAPLHQPLFERAAPGMLDLDDGYLIAPELPGLGLDLADLVDFD